MQRVIEFSFRKVPKSWSNEGVYSRGAAIAQSKAMLEWEDSVAMWGLVKRNAARWERAESTDTSRLISVHQLRHGTLDKDNLYYSAKPIVDGCKVLLTRGRKVIYGAGLIYNDDPSHCLLIVTQERVPFKIPVKTIVRVERFDVVEDV